MKKIQLSDQLNLICVYISSSEEKKSKEILKYKTG